MEHGRTQTLLREAIASAKAGNKSWARECLQRLLKIEPSNEEAWLWMSLVLETPAEKRFCLQKVLAVNPQNAQALAGLRYLDQQSKAPIRPIVQPKRTICPMCGEPNAPQAFQCVNCGQDLFVLCPSCGERVDIDTPSCAACGLEIGDSAQGAAYFFHLGELYLQHGQPKRAIDTLDRTLILNPDFPRVTEVAADAYLACGQRDLAIQSLQRAIEETKDEAHRRELRLRMANFHRELRNTEEAGRLYQELLEEQKELKQPWIELYIELGRFYREQNDSDSARDYYEMALALDENLPEIRFAVAEIILEKGYELRALSEFRELQGVGGEIGEKAKAHVEALRPPVPDAFRNRWQETMRGTARYVLAGLLLLALSTGRNWTTITPNDLVGILACMLGGYLVTAATATPRNLPTPAMFSKVGDTPMLARMRLRSQKKKAAGRPSALRKFLARQSQAFQRLAAGLRVAQMRALRWLQRTSQAAAQRWTRFKQSPTGKKLRAFFQSKPFRALAALGQKPFFRSIGRSLRRLFPAGTFGHLGQTLRGGGRRLVEQAGRFEVTEMQIYRWIAAVLGIFLLLLAGRLILI